MLDDMAFWRLLRKELLPLRPSQYDITSVCNLTCEGCLFFSSDDYQGHKVVTDLPFLPQQPGQRTCYDQTLNQLIHEPTGLYPDVQAPGAVTRDCGVLLRTALRHYNTDLSQSSGKCCTPNIDCGSCRLYAQSFPGVLTREIRRDGALARLIKRWRRWCELFLSDDCLRWRPAQTHVSSLSLSEALPC